MCDTSVAVGSATVDGSVIFAKNSDRKANECQPLNFFPRREHPKDATLRCTHREISQARETFAVLGSRPHWMWGFEMGINEHGVTIGNEAVYGREGYATDGLLGMDLLRLGLERGKSAYLALHVITELLEYYGQGGIADRVEPRSYHNSFIIADPTEAWVLETAGRYWVAERVRGRRAISNCFTIGTTWDESSADLIDHAVAQGWWERGVDFDFARAYGNPDRDVRSGQCRFHRATEVLASRARLDVPSLMAVLRDHAGVMADASGAARPAPICMHPTPSNLGRPALLAGKTVASLVAHLRPDCPTPLHAVAWHTFGSPCLSAFHPLYPAAGPSHPALAVGDAAFDRSSPWWRNEQVQRRVDAYPSLEAMVQASARVLEQEALGEAARTEERVAGRSSEDVRSELCRLSDALTEAYLAALERLDDATQHALASSRTLFPANPGFWSVLNEPVGLDLLPSPMTV